MKNIMAAGLKFMASPGKSLQYPDDVTPPENDFSYDEAFTAPSAPVDNMSILHSALQQQASKLQPLASENTASTHLSDAQRYGKFCAETGIIATSADYFVWMRENKKGNVASPAELPSPMPSAETPANNAGKITVTRLSAVGVLCHTFVYVKLLCGFSKTTFIDATRYDVDTHTHHSAGMSTMSADTVWACLTITNITPTMCDELVKSQYTARVLDNEDSERPIYSLLRFLEVTLGVETVTGLRCIVQNIRTADSTKGYGAPFRLLCFLYVLHRLVQDSLHGTQHTQAVHTFMCLLDDENTSSSLISAYFSEAKDSRLRIKDADHALQVAKLSARIDLLTRNPPALSTKRKEVPGAKGDTKLPQVCLPFMRDPSLCTEPCALGKLHSWPATMPSKSREYLLARAAKLPLAAPIKKPAGGSTAGSQRSSRTPHQASSSSIDSVTSSISSNEDNV